MEDNLIANLKLQSKTEKEILCSLHLNYFEKPKRREIELIGEKGKIECDLNKFEIKIYKYNKIKKIKIKINRNEIFKKQVKYFLSCIKNKKKIGKSYDVINGIKSLKVALKLKNENK